MFLLQAIWAVCFKLFKKFCNYCKKGWTYYQGKLQQLLQPQLILLFLTIFPIQHLSNKMLLLMFQRKSSSPWYFDFGASNHMTNIAQLLTNIKNIMKISRFILMGDQHSGKIIAKRPKVGRLFLIHFLLSPNLSLPLVSCNFAIVDYQVWHKRLGHSNSNVLHDMLKYGFLGNKHTSSLNVVHFDCISCMIEKSKILSFSTHYLNVTQPFDIIYSDVWGVAPIISHANYKYFITSIDDYSCLTWVYFLHSKGEVFSTFKFFYAYVQTQFLFQNQNFFYNNGGEYTSHSFQEFLQFNGLVHQPHNKMRQLDEKNCHFLDVVHTLLLESYVPSHFWCEVISIAVHLINRLIFPSLDNESPFTLLFGHPPDYSTLHIFKCTKLNSQFVKCAFLGYSPHQKAFYVMILTSVEFGSLEINLYSHQASMVLEANLLLLSSSLDPSFFIQRTPKGIMVLFVYVDGIVVIGFDQEKFSRIKHMLHSTFHIKELEVHYHLEGILFKLAKVHSRFGQLDELTNSTIVDTPLEVNVKYRREECDILDDPTLYHKLVGSLIYVTITHLDISFVVHTISKFMKSPKHFHFSIISLWHLKGWFIFPTDLFINLQAYSDADWADCPNTRKSTTNWCMFLKQDLVSKSSIEAKYHTMSVACTEIIWLAWIPSSITNSTAY
ncbi:hypothetical protein CR513_46162, partial [Mucuna pruriens]